MGKKIICAQLMISLIAVITHTFTCNVAPFECATNLRVLHITFLFSESKSCKKRHKDKQAAIKYTNACIYTNIISYADMGRSRISGKGVHMFKGVGVALPILSYFS